jgi:hypothetical protein
MNEPLVSDIAREDARLRAAFKDLRRDYAALEQLKLRRLSAAAAERLGVADGATLSEVAAAATRAGAGGTRGGGVAAPRGERGPDEWTMGWVFAHWRRVLAIAFIVLVLQWRRVANLFDVAVGANDPPAPARTAASLQ